MAERVLGEILELLRRPEFETLRWHHCQNSRSCVGAAGMPDLFIVGPRGAVWAEVKPNRGARLRPEQTTWRYMLLSAGHRHVVWTRESVDAAIVHATLEGLL